MLTIQDVEAATTRDDLVDGYAAWIRAYLRGDGAWPCVEVNHAIIDRWSLSALVYIKAKAWKRALLRSRNDDW